MMKGLALPFAGAIALIAQVATPPSGRDAPAGSVSGHVLDADTHAALPGINVGIRGAWVVTDSHGSYRLRNLPIGRVKIEIEGHYLATSLTRPRDVTVIGGLEVSGIDLHVRLEGQISGRVIDDDGEPIPGTTVSVISREYSRAGAYAGTHEYSNGELWAAPRGSATTDDRGRYVIDRIPAGRSFSVLAYSPRTRTNPISDAPADSQSRKQTLVPTYYPNSRAAAGALPLVVHSQEIREGVDIRMSRSPSRCLEATLTAGGVPASMQFALEGEDVIRSHMTASPRADGTSGPDGRIRLCDLASGQYQLTAFRQTTQIGLPEYIGAVPISITNDDVRNVTVATRQPVTISGLVVWDETPLDEGPRPSLSIALQPGASRAARLSIPAEFSLQADPVSHYSFLVGGLTPPLYVKDIVYDGSSILRKSFAPGAGGKLGVVIGRNGGSVSARVATGDGRPVADAAVLIMAADAQTESELSTAIVVGQTDENGLYVAAGMPPGKYYILATNDSPAGVIALPMGEFSLTKTPEAISKFWRARTRGEEVEIGPGATVRVTLVPRNIN